MEKPNFAQNSINKMKNLYKNMSFNSSQQKMIIYALIIVIIIAITSYIINKSTKKMTNEKYMSKMLESNYPPKFGSIDTYNNNFKFSLRDYYIKSSYNSCCSGDYKNDYVDIKALKYVIGQGCRLLDFSVYSVNEKAVVAASSVKEFTYKETYNSIDFDKVMETVNRDRKSVV